MLNCDLSIKLILRVKSAAALVLYMHMNYGGYKLCYQRSTSETKAYLQTLQK